MKWRRDSGQPEPATPPTVVTVHNTVSGGTFAGGFIQGAGATERLRLDLDGQVALDRLSPAEQYEAWAAVLQQAVALAATYGTAADLAAWAAEQGYSIHRA
ncbi:hypothetical protein F4556_006413 [Kitasatospora gansuensis]|uniref:Uncharacterized protein n=1 Tax=Kitasatospora gansuensis TaxID=258050 RepID=A0A7W7WL41_9ACTN|nr:hypothetical protein [Kitasatospora gansuensis]MBB4950878.1 hypothetical protein [Kitasatospora gansuensis]